MYHRSTQTSSFTNLVKDFSLYTASMEYSIDQRWQIFARFRSTSLDLSQPKAEADEVSQRNQLNGICVPFQKYILSKYLGEKIGAEYIVFCYMILGKDLMPFS